MSLTRLAMPVLQFVAVKMLASRIEVKRVSADVLDNQDQKTRQWVGPKGTQKDIDLLKLLQTFWRGKWIVFGCAVIAMLLGGFYAFRMTVPIYKATAELALDSRQSRNVVGFESVISGLPGNEETIRTEIQVMTSRALGEKLVEHLNLVSAQGDQSIDPPTTGFSPKATIRKGMTSLFQVDETSEPELTQQQRLDRAVTSILSLISVTNQQWSYVFEITATTRSPQRSVQIANALAEIYIEDQVNQKFEATEQAAAWLSDRVAELQAELEESETKAKDFNASIDLGSIDSLDALNRQLKDLRDRAEATRDRAVATQSRLDRMQEAADNADRAAILAAANDPELDRIASGIRNGRASEKSFQARLQKSRARAEQDVARFELQASALEASVADLTARVETQSRDLVMLQQLEREVEANRLIYGSFLVRLREISLQQGIQKADARILSPAVLPRYPFAPNRTNIIVISMLIGALFGCAVVLLNELRKRGFRTAKDLQNATGYQVIGQIPTIPVRKRSKLIPYMLDNLSSPSAEASRNLRTSIELSNIDAPPQVIMSTSCVPGEGKTTTAILLAYHYAGLGKKVLLFEGDNRRQVLDQYIDIKGRSGFVSVLAGDTPLRDALVRDERLGIDILPGERSRVNAADLFATERFGQLIDDLRANYDKIIIDTPPVLVVPDARSVGRRSDAIVFSVKWDSTTDRQVEQGLAAFSSVGIKPTGLVLTNVSARGMRRYGYGRDYGGYGYDYGGKGTFSGR